MTFCPPVTSHPESFLCHFLCQVEGKTTHTMTTDPRTSCLKITISDNLDHCCTQVRLTISSPARERLCSWAGSGFETCGFISYSADSELDRFLFLSLFFFSCCPLQNLQKRVPGSDAVPLSNSPALRSQVGRRRSNVEWWCQRVCPFVLCLKTRRSAARPRSRQRPAAATSRRQRRRWCTTNDT